jgi:hypothetical protein
MTDLIDQPFWRRFLTAFTASSILVFACSLSMQLHALLDPEVLLAVALGVTISSVPGAAIATLLFRRNLLGLIIASQVLTISALASFFAFQA